MHENYSRGLIKTAIALQAPVVSDSAKTAIEILFNNCFTYLKKKFKSTHLF
jgi:hypothetical protein